MGLKKTSRILRCFLPVFLGAGPACDRDGAPAATPPPEPPRARLIFPDSLRVAEEDINLFVRNTLSQCAAGDYDAFRSIWTAKQKPISREEFQEGWHSVDKVEVQALQKALVELDENSPRETVYVLLVAVSLDPNRKAGKREPLREIVLMIVREHDQWRIAGAPKEMRKWIKDSISHASQPAQTATP